MKGMFQIKLLHTVYYQRLIRMLLIVFLSLFIVRAHCGNMYKRSSSQSSAISINVKFPYFSQTRDLNEIYFVKLDNTNQNLYTQNKYIRSSYIIEDRQSTGRSSNVFLLNAEPGRYAAIGGSWSDPDRRKNNSNEMYPLNVYFFPKRMISLTVVNLGPNQFKHMGDYIIDSRGNPELKDLFKIKNADSAQLHYCRLIKPDSADPSAKSCASGCCSSFLDSLTSSTPLESVYAAKLVRHNKSKSTLGKAFSRSLRQLSGTAWVPLLKRELQHL